MSREVLKQTRKGKGMTVRVISELLGVSERLYKYVEAGHTTGKAEMWDALEDILGINQRSLRELHPCPRDDL